MLQSIAGIRGDARKLIEALYEDTCTIYIRAPAVNAATGITEYEERAVYTDLPCRLSFSDVPPAADGETPAIEGRVKLFLAPEIEAPPGCRFDVTRLGEVTSWERSGKAARYATHQEINVEAWKRWS